MDLMKYDGESVKIIDPDGKTFTGFCSDYFFPEDNENEKESIVIETNDGRLIEFYDYDIQSIEILSEHAELKESAV